jgi:hypothetical protein
MMLPSLDAPDAGWKTRTAPIVNTLATPDVCHCIVTPPIQIDKQSSTLPPLLNPDKSFQLIGK